jgi:hypothetical protein
MEEITKTQSDDELADASDPRVWALLGIKANRHPRQAAYRLARERRVPHVQLGRSIRFSLRALREWAQERARESVAA